jgi:hypothetical protein
MDSMSREQLMTLVLKRDSEIERWKKRVESLKSSAKSCQAFLKGAIVCDLCCDVWYAKNYGGAYKCDECHESVCVDCDNTKSNAFPDKEFACTVCEDIILCNCKTLCFQCNKTESESEESQADKKRKTESPEE